MIVQCIEYLKKKATRLRYFLFLIVAIVAVWSLTVDLHHAHTWAEQKIPVFWGLFAGIAVLVLIYFSRWFARCGIKAPEDYYER